MYQWFIKHFVLPLLFKTKKKVNKVRWMNDTEMNEEMLKILTLR